jgi:ribonucleoside-diphosphate reductase alpha chain
MRINGIEVKEKMSPEEIEELVSRSPYYKATSADVDWMEKVRMQGKVQKWVDHSISVTINLPSDVTEELVDNLYKEAWKVGCKGCTVYRDGSRNNVLESVKKEKPKSESLIHDPEHPIKRPVELEADVVRFQNSKEKWIAFVGLVDGRPYEIFTGLADDEDGIFCPKNVTHGKIIKAVDANGRKRYDFQFVNKRGFKTTIEGLSEKFNPEFWNYAKLISGVLRYGMPIDQVLKLVGGLELDSTSINTWKNGVERTLKKYMPNGAPASGQKCPHCGAETLVYQEGCLICTSCGTSKCG